MAYRVIEPKFLMLNGKNAFPNVSYEHFLLDVINGSRYFSSKHSFMEHYQLVENQSHGENDVYSSTYQLDFKLLISSDVMRERHKNMPRIDYSRMAEGFIFSWTKDRVSEIPPDTILTDIEDCKLENLRAEQYKNNTIQNLIKNLKKNKNIFMYYPYEYEGVTRGMMQSFEKTVTRIFTNVLTYRDELNLNKDTFVCFKINAEFVILEWIDKCFIIRDSVHEMLCANYHDAKTYSVY